MAKECPKIIIIGAGIAGISAVAELYKQGFTNTVILEAQDIIGGRIQTRHFGDSHIELGAQWIHGKDGNPLYSLASQHDLIPTEKCHRYEDPNKESFFYFQNGEKIDSEILTDVERFFTTTSCHLDQYYRNGLTCEDSKSVGEVFYKEFQEHLDKSSESLDVKRQKQAVFDWYCREECADTGCHSIYDASVNGWGLFYECGGQIEVNLSTGYRPILELILAKIPKEAILLNKPVEHILWHEGETPCTNASQPVTLQCKDGGTFSADHVIVTASAGFLKQNANSMFHPPLPKRKMDALKGIGFGTVDKIFLEFEKPFWEEHCDGMHFVWSGDEPFQLDCIDAEQDVDREWYKSLLGFQTVTNHPNILLGWIAGTAARQMESCSDDMVLKVSMAVLRRFTGNPDIPQPVKFFRTNWHSNPYVCGSYSYLSVAGHTTDFATLAEPLPSKQNPQVLFAGEATSSHHFSTTHGAYSSGVRAAHSIIQIYNKDHTHDLPTPSPWQYEQRVMTRRQ
ncbi:spermine oxidase-like [Lineus longissimus]|uniref:spermine oxidase-like n=1 Tax=Lineus longissimus TaxID=88925 RepID=UPI002B4FB58E